MAIAAGSPAKTTPRRDPRSAYLKDTGSAVLEQQPTRGEFLEAIRARQNAEKLAIAQRNRVARLKAKAEKLERASEVSQRCKLMHEDVRQRHEDFMQTVQHIKQENTLQETKRQRALVNTVGGFHCSARMSVMKDKRHKCELARQLREEKQVWKKEAQQHAMDFAQSAEERKQEMQALSRFRRGQNAQAIEDEIRERKRVMADTMHANGELLIEMKCEVEELAQEELQLIDFLKRKKTEVEEDPFAPEHARRVAVPKPLGVQVAGP
mmetsp:Transcript_28647/g.69258  ORF Transcript_28647/g.69258 Transcript_28647/m.69258 type:complete len:266 (+) Transcript_28647:21-818(+)